MATPDNISVVPSDATFEETLKRLRGAIAKRGLTLFAEIDHAENARAAGLEMPQSTVLIFGNAVAGTPLMLKAPDIAIELPLRVLVREEGRGGAVLAYSDPRHLASTFDVEEVAAGIMGSPRWSMLWRGVESAATPRRANLSAMSQSVIDDTTGEQFAVSIDGTTATLEYKLRGDRLHLLHTEVPEAFRGQGVGGRLVEAALAKARADHLTIVPWCPYAREWLKEHPDQIRDVTLDFKTRPSKK